MTVSFLKDWDLSNVLSAVTRVFFQFSYVGPNGLSLLRADIFFVTAVMFYRSIYSEIVVASTELCNILQRAALCFQLKISISSASVLVVNCASLEQARY